MGRALSLSLSLLLAVGCFLLSTEALVPFVPATRLQVPQISNSAIHYPFKVVASSSKTRLFTSEADDDKDEISQIPTDRSDSLLAEESDDSVKSSSKPAQASKRKMLAFALPALGIFLSNPLLSNIDNAFVGKTVGAAGLAALSPATICTDQMLYLFSFLGRATTGLVSLAYKANEEDGSGDTEAAREAASSPFTVSLFFGIIVTGIYALFTPNMLSALKVTDSLRGPATSYIQIRGGIAWAAMAQNVVLNILLATRDAMTPLKIVTLGAVVNIIVDAMLCVWPFRLGCAGAGAATSFATLFCSVFMMQTLRKKGLLPRIKMPTKKQIKDLLEFTGPLLGITITRLLGAVYMQKSASLLGVKHLAAYQMTINLMFLFMLFGEPLSQLSQTQLPAMVDSKKPQGEVIGATLKSILVLAGFTSVGVGGIAAAILGFGSNMFTSDAAVQSMASGVAPSLFVAVATGIFTVAVDGAMLASRDFSFMLVQGTLSLILQWLFLTSSLCNSVSAVFNTYTIRLGIYSLFALLRVAMGRGPLGRALRRTVQDGQEKINGAAKVVA